MRLGEKFILSVIQRGDVANLLEVPDTHFVGEESKMYEFAKDYYVKYGKLPPFGILEDKFSGLSKVTGSPDYFSSELLQRYIYSKLGEGIPPIIRGLKADPIMGLEKLREVISELELSTVGSEDMPYNASVLERFLAYKARLGVEDGVTYISTGDKVLDRLTFGIRINDLWTYGGRAGSFKTWWIVRFAIMCSRKLPTTLGPALLITNEIGLEELGERIDAINFKLGYERLLSGELQADEARRYKLGAKKVSGKASKLIVIFNCATLDELRQKIRLYNPAVVFLDGSYLMEPQMEEGMQKTTYITRNLKAICKDLNTPIINTTQLRKGTGKRKHKDSFTGQDEFFYGSYTQDSDLAIQSFITPDMVYHHEVGMDFVKARRMKRSQIAWKVDLDAMEFGYKAIEPESTPEVKVDKDV